MAYQPTWFVVLSLLQLGRAEIVDTLHDSWYSANVINDGYQPKPITEIFSTEATFSQTHPIIIVPESNIFSEETSIWSTHTPSTHTFSSTDRVNSRTESVSTPVAAFTSVEETKTSLTTASAPITRNPTVVISSQTEPTQTTVVQTMKPIIPETRSTQQPKESNTQRSISPTYPAPAAIAPQPNFFVIYQQNPQSIQSVPIQSLPSDQTAQSITVTHRPSESTILSQPSSMVTDASNPTSTTSTLASESLSSRVSISSTPTTRAILTNNNTEGTRGSQPSTFKPLFPLRIRVLAPSGSITNIKINPTTTTRKPTTIRTRKPRPKKNSYNICVNSCEESKVPICAAPLSKGLIDPDTLKGFPSVCHMACHNAFKSARYEKLVDGRCGKLRTRIRPVDSKTKLKRTELIKAEYTVDNIGPKATVEFASLN